MSMLRSIKNIQGYVVRGLDDEIGRCSDFLYDDRYWAIRYLVANTSKWLPGRKVLISPMSIKNADGTLHRLHIDLTTFQIKTSPPLDSDAPVSRQYERAFHEHYNLPLYWGGPSVWGPYIHPRLLQQASEEGSISKEIENTTNLRSTKEVAGYHIQAEDTDIGHVEDFIVDYETWLIRYVVVDTSNWLPTSKKVLISPGWVDRIDWKHRKALVDLTSGQIKNSPEYHPHVPVNREYEAILYDFYGRPYYW